MFKQGQGQGLEEVKKMNMGRVNKYEGGLRGAIHQKSCIDSYLSQVLGSGDPKSTQALHTVQILVNL